MHLHGPLPNLCAVFMETTHPDSQPGRCHGNQAGTLEGEEDGHRFHGCFDEIFTAGPGTSLPGAGGRGLSMLAAQAASLSGARLVDSIPMSACSLGGFSKELSRKEKFSLYPSSKETCTLCICFPLSNKNIPFSASQAQTRGRRVCFAHSLKDRRAHSLAGHLGGT